MFYSIGILGALPQEVELLTQRQQDTEVIKVGGVEFHCGNIGNLETVICCAGMGKVAAAAATQLLCTAFECDAVIFSGIAGNMCDEISVNDVVLGKTVLYHDAEIGMIKQAYPNLESYSGDAVMLEVACKACEKLGITYKSGTIATGDLFVGSNAMKESIKEKCNPDCVEMEGAAVMHIAAKNDRPCLIVRAMSDNADDKAGEEVAGNDLFDVSEYCSTASNLLFEVLENLTED